MRSEFVPFLAVGDALAELFHPHLEVVMHEIASDQILYIKNNFSKRIVGDASLLDHKENYPDHFEPYFKTGWNGHRIRSVSVTIRDKNKEAIGLLCFNMDVEFFEQFYRMTKPFFDSQSDQKDNAALFANDWQEKMSAYVHNYLKSHHLSVSSLSKDARRRLIKQIQDHGGFKASGAADHAARVLGVSRATIYNDFKFIEGK